MEWTYDSQQVIKHNLSKKCLYFDGYQVRTRFHSFHDGGRDLPFFVKVKRQLDAYRRIIGILWDNEKHKFNRKMPQDVKDAYSTYFLCRTEKHYDLIRGWVSQRHYAL